MLYRDEFIRLSREIREIRDDLEEELSLLPEGELYINTKGKTKCYYRRLRKEGNRKKEQRIGISKDPDMLGKLVRKKYVANALKLSENNLSAIEEFIKQYEPFDENSVMIGFIDKYPELSDKIYYGNTAFENWADDFTPDNDFHPESLKSLSSDGTPRRSLGEILIGAKLRHYGLPYCYEAKINHPDLPFIPDFKIRRPRDWKIIYWEHIGKVNDEDYLAYNRYKLREYEKYGIVPWDNLILSYDQKDGGINEKLIDALIQGWLL